MKKIIIIYQSKYGATKQYAQWLSGKLKCETIEKSKCKIEMLKDYDVIIYGGGIYATGIAGFSFLKKNYQILEHKKLIVFAVGASPYEEAAISALKQRNFKDDMSDLPCFYCRGTFNESIMTIGDKILINMLKKAVSKKDPAKYEIWESALMEAVGKEGDWTSEEYLAPIIDCVKDYIK
jgi:menaquinone-dependent protoporphyrinogen IX oxidase